MENLSTLGNKSHSSQKNQINYVIITLQDNTRIILDVNTYHVISSNSLDYKMSLTNIDRFNNKFKYVLRAIKRNNNSYYYKEIKKEFKKIDFGGINSKHTPKNNFAIKNEKLIAKNKWVKPSINTKDDITFSFDLNKNLIYNKKEFKLITIFVEDNDNKKSSESIDITKIAEDSNDEILHPKIPKFHKRISTKNSVKLISGLVQEVEKIKVKDLRKIHNNKEIAKELLILFLSYFTQTRFKDYLYYTRYVRLCKVILFENFDKKYKDIIEVLINNDIIIKLDFSRKKSLCTAYQLTDRVYNTKSLKSYKFKEKQVIDVITKSIYKQLARATKNTIARTQIFLYGIATLPSDKKIKKEIIRLNKEGYTNKGIKYKRKPKNKEYIEKYREEGYRFFEDDVEIFKYLTEPSYLIPSISEYAGRVATSFTLMPKWLRNMVKIDGERILELDFEALHPNIGISRYGSGRHISHDEIAEYLITTKEEIKQQHLSIFNRNKKGKTKKINNKIIYEKGFDEIKLHEYYRFNEPGVYEEMNKKGKLLGKELQEIEVKIMYKIIEKMENLGLYGMYVYDALYVKESDYNTIKQIMNETIKEFGINTFVK